MKTPEQKVAEQLATLTESHWFNPISLARILTDQPFYTTDRMMELVAQVIHWASKRHQDELTPGGVYESGSSSEGLFLANELNKTLAKLKTMYDWENIELPKEAKELGRNLPNIPTQEYRYSWIHNPDTSTKVTIEHPFI